MIASVSKTIEKIYRAWICQQVDFKVLCDLFQSSESNHNHRILPESSESIASNCHRMNASVSMTLESIDRAWICQQFDFKVIATVWLLLSLRHLKKSIALEFASNLISKYYVICFNQVKAIVITEFNQNQVKLDSGTESSEYLSWSIPWSISSFLATSNCWFVPSKRDHRT